MKRVAVCVCCLLTNAVLACQSPSSPETQAVTTTGSGSAEVSPAEGSSPSQVLSDADLEALTRTLARLRVVGREHPERLDAAIADTGLSAEQIDAALFRIAADPAASALYVQLSGE